MEPEKVKIQGSLKCAAINTKVFQRRFLKLKKKNSHEPWSTLSCRAHGLYVGLLGEGEWWKRIWKEWS